MQRSNAASTKSFSRSRHATLPLQLVRSSMHSTDAAVSADAWRRRSSAAESDDLSEVEEDDQLVLRRPIPIRHTVVPPSNFSRPHTQPQERALLRSAPPKTLTRRPLALFAHAGSPILSATHVEQQAQASVEAAPVGSRSLLDEEFLALQQIPRTAAALQSQARAAAAKAARSRPPTVVIPTDDSPDDIELTSPQVSAIPILPPIEFEPVQPQQQPQSCSARQPRVEQHAQNPHEVAAMDPMDVHATAASSAAQSKSIATHSPTAVSASSHGSAAAPPALPLAPVPPPVQIVQLQFKSVAQRRKEKQQTATSAAAKPVEAPVAEESSAEMSDEAAAAKAEQLSELESDEDQPWIVLDDTEHPYTAEEAEILRHSRRLPLSRIRMPGARVQPASAAPPVKQKQPPVPRSLSPPPRTSKSQASTPSSTKQPKRKRAVIIESSSSSSSEGAVSSDADSSSEDNGDYAHLPPRHMLTRAQRKDAGDLMSDAESLPERNTRRQSSSAKPTTKPAPSAAAARPKHSKETAAVASAHKAALIAGAGDKPWESLWPIEQLLLSSPSNALEDMVSQWCRPGSNLYSDIIDSWTGKEISACLFHLGMEVEPKGAGATAKMKNRLKVHLRNIARDYPELFTQNTTEPKKKGSTSRKRSRLPASKSKAASSDRSKSKRASSRRSSISSESSSSSSSSSSSDEESSSGDERQVQKRSRVTRKAVAAKRPSPVPAPYDASRMPKVIDLNAAPPYRPWVGAASASERSPAPADPFAPPLTPTPSPPPQVKSPLSGSAAPLSDPPMRHHSPIAAEETVEMTHTDAMDRPIDSETQGSIKHVSPPPAQSQQEPQRSSADPVVSIPSEAQTEIAAEATAVDLSADVAPLVTAPASPMPLAPSVESASVQCVASDEAPAPLMLPAVCKPPVAELEGADASEVPAQDAEAADEPPPADEKQADSAPEPMEEEKTPQTEPAPPESSDKPAPSAAQSPTAAPAAAAAAAAATDASPAISVKKSKPKPKRKRRRY